MQPSAIGPFEVQRELGRGGMGVVYLARDSRLDRLVAIKSLPEHLASDPDRLARFQREAKVLASLNHPGISAIYGIEEVGGAAGQQFLILEYVEGQTLAERLDRGALPLEEALTIAQHIAEALEAAHERGVIHRDIKPGNVMVTADGAVKLLDFGVARTQDSEVAAPISPSAATVKSPSPGQSPTLPGAILGSPGYMSPEQALGKPIDKRSDIFAFGCVLYEMLAGVKAFPGENQTAALGALLHLEPDWTRLADPTPARIRDLLRSLTAKDRRNRLHDIGDARLAIERSLHARDWEHAPSGPRRRRHPIARILPWALIAGSIALIGAAMWQSGASPKLHASSPAPVVRLRVDDPDAPLSSVSDIPCLAISPDGKRIAYLATIDGIGHVAIRGTDDFSINRVKKVPADMFFAADGGLVFTENGKDSILSLPAGGNEPVSLFESQRYITSKGCAWSPRGIVFSQTPNSGLSLLPAGGGPLRTITTPDLSRNEVSHRWPDVLPDGKHALMTIKKFDILTFDEAEIALVDLDTGKYNTIIRGGSFARYVSTGHIAYARNGSIMAVPFDAASGEVTGSPVAVVSGVMMSAGSGAAKFAIARDAGTLVYVPGGNDEQRIELLWVDMTGKIEPVGTPIMPYFVALPSPDGTRIATGVYGASDSIFVYDIARRTNTRITFRGNCGIPFWLPDSTKIAFASDAGGPTSGYVINADGSGTPEKVAERSVLSHRCVVLLDGKPVNVFEEDGDIYLQPFHSEIKQKLVATQFQETAPQVSPDGHWLSYASNETGSSAVYVRPFPSGEGRWQVFSSGGQYHCWSKDSSVIFGFNYELRQVFRVSFHASPRVEVGAPQVLFSLPPDVGFEPALHASGDKFLSGRNLPPRFKGEQVCVVLNWFEELNAKVPTPRR